MMNTPWMDFHFLKLQIQTHHPNVIHWLHHAYLSHDLSPIFPEEATVLNLIIEAQDSEHAFQVPSFEAGLYSGYSFGLWPCHFHEGHFLSEKTGPDSLQIDYDVEAESFRVNLAPVYLQSEWAFIHLFFRSLLRSFVFSLHGLMTLHGAVLVKDNEGILLLGDKGAGKSTTCLCLAEAGYAIVSDDSPFLVYHQGKATVLSSLDTPRMTEQTLNILPVFKNMIDPTKDPFDKYALDRSRMPDSAFCQTPVSIRKIIILNRGIHETVQFERRKKSQLLGEMIHDYSFIFKNQQLTDFSARFKNLSHYSFTALSQLVEDADAYDLFYADSHLSQLPALIEAL